MKLLYDFDIFHRQNYGGISKYHAELIKGLKQFEDVQISFPILYNENQHLNPSRKEYISGLNELSGNRITKSIARLNQLLLNNKLKKQDFDIFITTYYNNEFLKYIGNKPFILSVLDMIHELYPSYFTRDKTTVKNKLNLIRKATRIVTISENTKKDILQIYPDTDADKIDVVYLGYTKSTDTIPEVKVPQRYILFVGQRAAYKNFDFFFRSAIDLLQNNKDLFLVCTGPDFNPVEKSLFTQNSLEKKVLHISVDDNELAYLYKNAICFVFPSLYEGFGIPLIEAMANDCPIITSHSGSLSEVAGEAAEYFEIGNKRSLTDSLYKLVSDANHRKDLIEKGRRRSELFTWRNTVNSFYETLKKIY
jgi:glycosyltransferase involved in cell wall biosynthesis